MTTRSSSQQVRIGKESSDFQRVGGFALVVTVSLMLLMVMLAVGLLSLSSISLRNSGRAEAEAVARANARLALSLAIGELQRHAGPDTRVTAPADILDKNYPPLIGVWKSWEGTDHETRNEFAGRPKSPNYALKQKSTGEGGRFLSWLVSSDGRQLKPADAGRLAKSGAFEKSIALLSGGSLAEADQREIHVPPMPLGKGGSYAWWVSGENQKARIPVPYEPNPDTAARWTILAKSHSVADPKPFGLESLLDDASPASKGITRNSAELLAKGDSLKRPRDFFHDLSADSVGLLTNTATGGWRKDLSLLTEAWDAQPTSRLPLFRVTPTEELQYNRPSQGDAVPPVSMLYPWASYRGGQNIPIYQHGPVTSWANLADYATHYKRISASPNGKMTTPTYSVAIDNAGNSFGFLHKVRILPIIARMQWVFSHSAGAVPSDASKLEPRLLLTPVITMWNPYNMEITAPVLNFTVPRPLPAALRYTVNGVTNANYNSLTTGSTNNTPSLSDAGSLRCRIPAPFTLKPGETRLFSPLSTTPVAANAVIDLDVRYRSGGGYYFPVKDNSGSVIKAPAAATIKADAKFDTAYNDRSIGVGIYLDMNIDGPRHLVYRMVYTPDVANVIYKPLTRLASATLSQCVRNPQPFLSTIFGARTASRTHLAAKGFVQSSPLVNYTAMGGKDEVESTISRDYGGTEHPVNSPFDYSFVSHAPGGDSLLPNANDTTGRGYIVTGFNKSDGLSRCVISELPARPLVSLGELVNWDLRFENPIPPYALNLIGNSDATPLLPANAVVNSNDAGLAVNLQYDDSYCANHLLFDDWFVSSITPDPGSYGTSGRSQRETFMDFVNGKTPLANRSYQAILRDRAAAAAGGAQKLYDSSVAKANSWQSIASRIEVEGMFNVNSTSITAWRALLGHARDQRVPYIRESGTTWDVNVSKETDHVLGRFSIAGDTEAGSVGSSGAFPEATEFAGYRKVDEKFIDQLAEKIVDQVRKRGPFLSLSEFVNRQLSSGDLALAGALQSALNEVARTSGNNIFGPLEALSSKASSVPERAAEAEYQFPKAAEGYSGYGMPGWTRQADILRPIAPILSARDDTFTIRAYGDARDASGNLLARVHCEAVVRRTRDFVDPADAAEITAHPSRPINLTFGRRFSMISFRWLAAEEV